MSLKKKTPYELGFRMPAEWEIHDATWLSWPKDPLTFPEEIIRKVEEIYVEMIQALQAGERVELLVDDQKTEDRVSSMLSSKKNVRFHHVKTADVWIRDYGPIFVKNSERNAVAATKWIFNAWGRKYDELLRDNDSGIEVCKKSGVEQVFEPGIVLEGGSIDVNGTGSCFTTKQCLLNRNRNPQLDQVQIEKYLRDYLGALNVIWLGEGIAGDDTDGHVDDIARFVDEKTVLCMIEEDPGDVNYPALQKNYAALKNSRDPNGNVLEVIPLRMPQKVRDAEGNLLPASYANFCVGNSAVLVPIFGVRNDDQALSKISELYPHRKTVGINCRDLVYGFGAIHCVTQQQPFPMTS